MWHYTTLLCPSPKEKIENKIKIKSKREMEDKIKK